MSTTVDQLKALLSRVEARRHGPRLRAVPGAVASTTGAGSPAAFAATPLGTPAPANEVRPAERISALPERKPPTGPTPLEHAIAGGLSPTPVPGNKPASMELDLDDFDAPQTGVAKAPPAPVSRGGEVAHRTAPTVPQTDPFAADPFASSPPAAPAARPAPAPAAAKAPAPAPAPAPTAPTARIAAPEPATTAPVARAMTRARVETPRTFGELLDQSLALRPRD